MSTHSGDYGLLAHAFFLPIGLTAVNNVITYDEFSSFHDGFHDVFTIHLLSCRLTPCLKAGACAADSVNDAFNVLIQAFNISHDEIIGVNKYAFRDELHLCVSESCAERIIKLYALISHDDIGM